MKIPEKNLKKVKSWAKQTGRTEKDIMILYENIFEREKSDYPDANNYHHRAIVSLKLTLVEEEGLDRSNAILFRGFFFGDTDVMDFVDIMKNKAKSWFKNPALRGVALKRKMVTRDGTPLDTRKVVNFQKNPNYLSEFGEDDHAYFRAIFGIAGEGKKMVNPKYVKLNINDPMKIDIQFLPNQLYDFRATIRKIKEGTKSNGILQLNATTVTKFRPSDVSLELNKKVDLVRQNKVWFLDDMETIWKMSGSTDRERKTFLRQNPILVESNVTNIYAKVNEKTKNRTLRLDDAESENLRSEKYTCFITGLMPIEFGENSRIIQICSLDKIKDRNSGKENLILNSNGYITVPELMWRKD